MAELGKKHSMCWDLTQKILNSKKLLQKLCKERFLYFLPAGFGKSVMLSMSSIAV